MSDLPLAVRAFATAAVMAVSAVGCARTEPTPSSAPIASSPSSASTGRQVSTTSAPDEAGRSTSTTPLPDDTPPAGALPAGPVTVVTLGDSLTEGDGDDDRHGYPERLAAWLEQGGRSGSTVVNLGLAGWTSQQVLEGQDEQEPEMSKALAEIATAKAKGQPVIAIVLIGSNDLWYLYANDAPTTEEEERDDLVNYRRNVTAIADRLTGAGAVLVLGINDDQSKRPVAADPRLRREAFGSISDDEVRMMSAQARRYADAVRDVAGAHHAPVADFLDAPFFSNPAMLADDGNHPNAAGYDQMTEVWLATLRPLLG